MKIIGVIFVTISLFFVLWINTHLVRQREKDRIIIRVFLTYHRDVLGQNLDPNRIYEDGLKWVNDPKYNAVEYKQEE